VLEDVGEARLEGAWVEGLWVVILDLSVFKICKIVVKIELGI
jgi:hypothetical protein